MPRTRAELAQALARQPRVTLATLPTPLIHAPRFSSAVGGEVWIKRDDLTGLALGGNKARKIEYLFGRAAADGAVDTVVTVGAPQSNHARTVAAAARLMGWECHLMLGGDRPARPTGNLVLDVALHATLHFAGTQDWNELDAKARHLSTELDRRGRRTVMIPMGGSTPTGALGFVAAYLELLDQLDGLGVTPSSIIHATSTGGTQAGLDYAHRVLGHGPEVIGVGVAKTQTDLTREVTSLEGGLTQILGLEPGVIAPTVLTGYLGEAYASPTTGGQNAFDLLAKSEAVLTDSVYSAKGLHAVVDRAAGAREPIVFWHTGGIPALFSDTAGIYEWGQYGAATP
ncbi:MAG: 1-aminocyclopropane-carboxylate deaminase [Mycobacterium sp.]|nr:1-aminocyclopropane-carboxylate deaminase [Mycobacterium sp.]MDT5175995.1 D-cysteine desulfhydrase [Mycobacterium sp.]